LLQAEWPVAAALPEERASAAEPLAAAALAAVLRHSEKPRPAPAAPAARVARVVSAASSDPLLAAEPAPSLAEPVPWVAGPVRAAAPWAQAPPLASRNAEALSAASPRSAERAWVFRLRKELPGAPEAGSAALAAARMVAVSPGAAEAALPTVTLRRASDWPGAAAEKPDVVECLVHPERPEQVRCRRDVTPARESHSRVAASLR